MEEYRGFTIFEERDEDNTLTLTASSGWDEVGVRANFAQASCPIEVLDDEGAWILHPQGKQVADYRHDSDAAIRDEIDNYLDSEY